MYSLTPCPPLELATVGALGERNDPRSTQSRTNEERGDPLRWIAASCLTAIRARELSSGVGDFGGRQWFHFAAAGVVHAAIELFADKDNHKRSVGMNNIIVKKMMELNRKMPNGMDMTFFIEAKAKALLFDYDRLMVLDKNGRIYTFQLAKDQFSMGKTGVGYLDDQYVNLFHRSQSQITNDIRRLVLPRLHFSSNQVNIQYGIQDIPEPA